MSSKTNAVRAIHNLLENGNEADRCFACHALGVLQDTKSIEKLSHYLQDEDLDVCIDAATALGQIADQQAIPFLLESMRHEPDGEVRTAVIEALGNIEDKRVTPALLSALSERPKNLEWDGNWDPWWDMQLKAVTALGVLRIKNAVPVLLKMLADDEYQDIETELLKALAQIGGAGITALMQHFTQSNSRVRRRVMIALRFSPQKQVGRELAKGIKDSTAEVRQTTIETLAELNAKHFLGALFLLIKDSDADVRASAIDAIFKITQNPDNANDKIEDYDLTINQLMTLLDDDDSNVRYMAASVLVAFDKSLQSTPSSLSDLDNQKIITMLADTDLRVAITACKLLAQLKMQQAISFLIEILSNDSKETQLRQHAAMALGAIGCAEQDVLSVLIENISDQHQIVRLTVLSALNNLDKQHNNQTENTPMDAIFSALKAKQIETENEQTSQKVTSYDSEIGADLNPVDTISAQNKTVSSTLDSIARDNIVIALALQESAEETSDKISGKKSNLNPELKLDNTDPALDEFIDIVKQNNNTGEWLRTKKSRDKTLNIENDIRYLAARILADSDRPEAVNALIETLGDSDAELRRESALSLGQIASRNPQSNGIKNSFGSLMLQLETGTFEIRLACVRALAALGNIEAMPAIVDCLQDKDSAVRIESIIALSKLFFSKQQSDTDHITINTVDSHTVVENIISKLDDTASGVRMNAASILLSILDQNAAIKASFSDTIVKEIISAAFKGDGGQARHMACILREINIDSAAKQVIPMLTTLNDCSERRFAVEILEELFKVTNSNQDSSTSERAA